jgi:hypothetical protein
MLIRACLRVLVLAGVLAAGARPVRAQTEDVEPRIIGERGVTLLGVSGSLSRFFSPEQVFAGTYTVQVDVHHFVFSRVAIRVGAVGTSAFGGSKDEESGGGIADGVEALGGALYYFTPGSIWSFYGGGEYRARVTNRIAGDAGSANAIAGLQGALSSRASFFVEGGWGMRLRRGDEDDLQTRIVGRAGVRFRF